MSGKITRRGLMGVATAAGVSACGKVPASESFSAKSGSREQGKFLHGVASGDPTSKSVVIWTRVTPQDGQTEITVKWSIATVPQIDKSQPPSVEFAKGKHSDEGELTTSAALDWTVKVNVTGLVPGRLYFFNFEIGSEQKIGGQTQTLPEGAIDAARFAVVSCANFQQGHFNPYDHIARQDHFDALIHLGDYLYEYGEQEMGTALGRPHDPPHEMVELDDYRRRYAQYRTDPNLQAVHGKLPMIHIWDDHETANDSWVTGAENHDPDEGEGDWEARKAAALKAYYEWMPVREPEPGKPKAAIFKSFDWGDLLRLVTLETRLMARSESLVIDDYFDALETPEDVQRFKDEVLGAPDRKMLGEEQLEFVVGALKESKDSGQSWRVIANQILMANVDTPDLTPHVSEESIANIETIWPGVRPFVEKSAMRLPLYTDCWDGYPTARERFYDRLKAEGLTDNLVLTGDSHEFWACDLKAKDGEKMGIELGASSVSSTTAGDFLGAEGAGPYGLLMTKENDSVRFYDCRYKGYIDLEITHNKGTATYWAVDTVASTDYTAFVAAQFNFKPKKDSLGFSGIKGVSLTQRALYMGLG